MTIFPNPRKCITHWEAIATIIRPMGTPHRRAGISSPSRYMA